MNSLQETQSKVTGPFLDLLERLSRVIDPGAVSIKVHVCPACGPSLMVRLREGSIFARCLRCRGTAVHLSLMATLKAFVPDLGKAHAYELSSRGPLFTYLKRLAGMLTCSEYFDEIAPGNYVNGIQCQNVEQLTYADASFDLCTSTEVFEHVANDRAGFAEMYRVLKPGGHFIFTVPLFDAAETVERARIENSDIHYILPAEYHGDALRGQGRVLVFRDYGRDITERLQLAGFREAQIFTPPAVTPWGYSVPVVVAKK